MNADLVLEGGGMRGIAHVGALSVLEERGYEFGRAAGTSAGAVIAAFAAAGVSPRRMAELLHTELDYSRFREARGLARLGLGGRLAAILRENGAFAADRLREWFRATLQREAGVVRFGDLRLAPDLGAPPVPEDERYRLVVIVADLSLGQLVRLPWDYRRLYGLTPTSSSSRTRCARPSPSPTSSSRPALPGRTENRPRTSSTAVWCPISRSASSTARTADRRGGQPSGSS